VLDLFLVRPPDHAEAYVTRARALARLGQGITASEDYSRAIARAAAHNRSTSWSGRKRFPRGP